MNYAKAFQNFRDAKPGNVFVDNWLHAVSLVISEVMIDAKLAQLADAVAALEAKMDIALEPQKFRDVPPPVGVLTTTASIEQPTTVPAQPVTE